MFDPAHVHHNLAQEWWRGNRNMGWASCPLTQNGFLRVISRPTYPNPFHIHQAADILLAQINEPGHLFWPDNLSLVDATDFDRDRILGPNQITDIYLLGLAVRNNGRLVTFDRAISLAAVHGARAQHLVVLS